MSSLPDRSRQWATGLEVITRQITKHHLRRYEFASYRASGRILDAACGCGYGTEILSFAGAAVGVDCSSDAIDWAKEHFHAQYILGRIEDSPWSGKFETIVSLETLEHLKEPEKALQAFRKDCVGQLIASVPNEEIHPFKAEVYVSDEWPHYRHYTPKEFTELLEGNGFSVVERFCQRTKRESDVVPGTDGMFLIYVCT